MSYFIIYSFPCCFSALKTVKLVFLSMFKMDLNAQTILSPNTRYFYCELGP